MNDAQCDQGTVRRDGEAKLPGPERSALVCVCGECQQIRPPKLWRGTWFTLGQSRARHGRCSDKRVSRGDVNRALARSSRQSRQQRQDQARDGLAKDGSADVAGASTCAG